MQLRWADPVMVTGNPVWPSRNKSVRWPPLETDIEADVLVIGAGITGALISHTLRQQGIDAVVVDKAQPGQGSTQASTALISYEFDLGLRDLAEIHGLARAQQAYEWCRDGVDRLISLVRRLENPCEYAPKRSVRLTNRAADLAELELEAKVREKAGLPVEFLENEALKRRFGLTARAGLASGHAAQIDPMRLMYGLLAKGRVFGNTRVTRIDADSVRTAQGHRIKTKRVILATGYESERYLRRPVAKLTTDFCLLSKPLDVGATSGCHFVENREFYLYASTFHDQLPVGLEGKRLYRPFERQESMFHMDKVIRDQTAMYLPDLDLQIERAWSATFAKSFDSLPYLDVQPNEPSVLFALGYGGNGIASSAMLAPLAADWVKTGKVATNFKFSR